MVISYAGRGTVYTFRPYGPIDQIMLLKAEPAAPRPGMTPVLPVAHWRLDNDSRGGSDSEAVPVCSPDGTTFIPAGDDFITSRMYYGYKLHDLLRGFGLAHAVPGKPFYVSDEAELQTYSATIDPEGTLTNVKLFAEQGGEGVAVDAQGNVYLAAGQILVYNPAGKLIDTIEVPERPLQLVFGGKDGRTLFIPARSSLYSVRTRFAGR